MFAPHLLLHPTGPGKPAQVAVVVVLPAQLSAMENVEVGRTVHRLIG